ncbi:MAG: UvrD-helicase domain-containing protein [Verrucomicrobia bacterium]|nr:UvrD-helicase domain-containing protein [Verrucomicrobiota bacterium]
MPLTAAQQQAVAAEGNVLVEAGAGAGKTRTLVERCLQRVLDENDPVSLDQILMVTFTEAAATEMRKRIREELDKKSANQQTNEWLAEQLALLDTARICTLHSFCLQLVREHFHELGLDPQLVVLDEAQSRLLAAESLDAILQRHYGGETRNAEGVQQLILKQARGWDTSIRELVLRVHEYTQTRPDPVAWLQRQSAMFSQSEPREWRAWLQSGLTEWRAAWLDALQTAPPENVNAQQCRDALRNLPENPNRSQAAEALTHILAADDVWPNKKKGAFRAPLKTLFAEAEFFQSLAETGGDRDPLFEDWIWVRPHMAALLDLVQEFTQSFAEVKRELAAVDFHDLEQFTLQLLWDANAGRPTPIALSWRHKLRLVFVDEYQDINAAQDKIIQCLGREGAAANRFLVGDVKQSIYRFRLADPHIFQNYKKEWTKSNAAGRVIPLSENFRSHEAILDFVNALFSSLMRSEVGGVNYDERARLRFGAPAERPALSTAADPAPRVELMLRLTSKEEADHADAPDNDSADADDVADLSSTETEGRFIALRLRELTEKAFPIWDRRTRTQRAIEWRDMVILHRSPRNKAESFAKVFAQLEVPLEAARGGFFDTTEVSDLLNLLSLLDNPLQDVPALAVLRSPLVGLSVDELAAIRLAQPAGWFWGAMERFHRDIAEFKSQFAMSAIAGVAQTAWPKVDAFLKSHGAWRRLARQGALSHCLETVLDETHYEDWLRAQPRGEQKRANVQRLLAMTRQFDEFQRQGLFRFLKFIEAQQKAEEDREPAAAETGDAVRLMSIHKSKGLEFPVVVVAGLGGKFNFADTHGDILLDEEFGLCPHVQPPEREQRYQSLPYWLASKRQQREMLGEELRLLYVAMTRACDKLILAGTTTRQRAEVNWSNEPEPQLTTHQILSAKQYLDWLGPLLPRLTGNSDWLVEPSGQSQFLSWRLVDSEDLATPTKKTAEDESTSQPVNAVSLSALRKRLAWRYPHPVATKQKAKTSVSAIRRRLVEEMEEAQPLFKFERRANPESAMGRLSAAEIGIAHHAFLQFMSLGLVGDQTSLTQEADRLEREQVLTPEQRAALDLAALASFWESEIGQAIRAETGSVHRELSFTSRIPLKDLAHLGLVQAEPAPVEEFVVVQGVADLVVLLPGEIWLLDFKTDRLTEEELAEKVQVYEPQIRLYALALGQIYRRPVNERWLHFLNLRKTVCCPPVECQPA